MQDIQEYECRYKDTCESKTNDCWEKNMNEELYAKPIIENKFWVVEKSGEKFATLRKEEDNRFVLSNRNGVQIYKNKNDLTKEFGKGFFVAKIIKEAVDNKTLEIHGFPCSVVPHNSMFDIRRKFPLFTKSGDSKSHYCAGYYIIRFDKGWVKSFCPKLITLQRYEYQGPFKTEQEMKQVLANVSK